MSNSEPLDFQHERRKRRPSEETVVKRKQSHTAPARKEVSHQEQKPKKAPCCSCCNREQVNIFLDLGQGILLCDGCIEVCNDILRDEGATTNAIVAPPVRASLPESTRTKRYCSFCGKEQADVVRLISMLNNLCICNRCVGT